MKKREQINAEVLKAPLLLYQWLFQGENDKVKFFYTAP